MTRNNSNQSSENQDNQSENILKFEASGQKQIDIPAGKFISDSEISRDGQDLALEASDGDKLIVENYFSVENAPILHSPDGSILTENLVNSFLKNSDQYAQMGTLNDESPIGAVEELEGSVKIIRADGSTESATLGSPIYEGDVIETGSDSAANILFLDETSLAVSDSARVSVDSYKFDAATESGETNLSVLRGVFVYTSGLIGRDDPDDVLIETPVGSIGIRGTIIAGNIRPEGKSEITVLEGAIVVSNGENEVTLSQQFETVKIDGFNDRIEPLGIKNASDMKGTYGSVQNVIPKLFSSINDNIRENNQNEGNADQNEVDPQENEQEVIDGKSEEETQEDLNPEAIEPNKVNNIRESMRDVLQENRQQNQFSDQDRENIREAFRNRFARFNNEDGVRDPLFNPFNPYSDNGFNPFTNVFASGAQISSALPPQRFDYNGDGVKDGIFADHAALSAGVFKVADGSGGFLIDATGSAGQGLGKDYDFIGDINNDGKFDFIVGSENLTTGRIDIFEVGDDNAVVGKTVVGSNTGDKLGYSVSGIGDFDGDGKSDYVYGVSGYATGDGKVQIQTDSGVINSNIVASGTEYGAYVSGIGDVNGDGLSDVLVGTENPDSGLYKAYIISGNDGLNGTITETIQSTRQIIAGGGIGDINGDGIDDFAVSMKEGNNSVTTYAVYGQAGGVGPTLDDTYLNDSSNALKIHHGISFNNTQEYSITSVGDKNGDGFDDFQIGVVDGQQFVVHGQSTGNVTDSDTVDGTNDGILTASAGNKNLVGDYNFNDGNEGNVSMRGSKNQNEFVLQNENFKNIDGGLGHDTLKIDGNLDFSAINFEQISQIEKIDIIGSGNGLTLTEENLFNLLKTSDTNEIHINGDGTSNLNIDVETTVTTASDISELASDLGGTYSNNATAGSDGYHHIEIGVYNLYIDSDVTVTSG
jgi:hypothetical protein